MIVLDKIDSRGEDRENSRKRTSLLCNWQKLLSHVIYQDLFPPYENNNSNISISQ